MRPALRESGQRRYAPSAVAHVGVILFFREVGFSLAQIGSLIAADEPMQCPRFWSIVEGHLRGLSLEERHAQVH